MSDSSGAISSFEVDAPYLPQPAVTIERAWLTVDEVEQYTGVSKTEVYIALQTAELPGSQRAKGGKWRIHRDDLDAWMRRGQRTPS